MIYTGSLFKQLVFYVFSSSSSCSGFGFLDFFDSSTFLQRFGNDPLKLAVRTTKLIGCPFFNGIHCFGIYAQNETFS